MIRKREHTEARLPAGFHPSPTTVVCGQGKGSPRFPGNKRFREIVSKHVEDYSRAAKKRDRTAIVSRILDKKKAEDDAPHFVTFRKENNAWYVANDIKAREKIGGMFRDSLYTRYKSSSKAKSYVKQNRLMWIDNGCKISSDKPAATTDARRQAPSFSSSSRLSNIVRRNDFAGMQQERQKGNPETSTTFHAKRAAAESFWRDRQAVNSIDYTSNTMNRQCMPIYDRPQAHQPTPNLYPHNLYGVPHHVAVQREQRRAQNGPLTLLERQAQRLFHYKSGCTDFGKLSVLALKHQSEMASPFVSPTWPSLRNDVLLGVQQPRLMEGVRRPYYSLFDRPPAICGSRRSPFEQADPYLFHDRNGDGNSNDPRLRSPQTNPSTDYVPSSRCASDYTTTTSAIPTTGRFEKNDGEKPWPSHSATTGEVRTIAEQIELYYGDDDERPPTPVASA
jgi:hypothetical protein